MSSQQIIRYYSDNTTDRGGCGGPVMMACVLLLFLICSCRSIPQESYVDRHQMDTLMEKMDSVISKSQTVVQDSAWHETVIKEIQSIKERNDTSRVVVVDTAGNVVKETVTIIKEREVSSETDRQEREVMIHKMEKMDSVMTVQSEQISRLESLLKDKQTTVEVPAELSWWQKLRLWLGNITLAVIVCLFGYGGYRIWKVYKFF